MRPSSEKKCRITIDLTQEHKRKLDTIGEYHQISNSEVIRSWIRATDLEEMKKK